MIPLSGSDFPKTRDEFRRALDDGLKWFGAPKGVVELSGEYPHFSGLKIDLSAGRVDASAKPPSLEFRDRTSGVEIDRLEISAAPLLCCDAPAIFHLHADGARLDFARDPVGKILLVPNTARGGDIDGSIRHADLEKLVRAVAHAEASKHGAKIDKVVLSFSSLGPRSLGFEAKITASMFMSTTIRVQGWLEIDNMFNLSFSRLTCEASGMIGTMASGFIRPQLERLQRQPIALASHLLGGLKLRDVNIDAGDPLRAQASFAEA